MKRNCFSVTLNNHLPQSKCDQCDEMFEGQKEKEKHIESIHASEDLKCHICEQTFSSEENLISHMEKEHTKGVLEEDIIIHIEKDLTHGLIESNSANSSLLKSFESNSEEDLVSENEIGDEYECNICDAKFIDIETLKRHNEDYHKLSLLYQCQQCEENFHRKEDFENHMENLHIESILASDYFKCQICEQTFSSDESFITHMEKEHTRGFLESTFVNPSLFN